MCYACVVAHGKTSGVPSIAELLAAARPEDRLLAACARVPLDPAARERCVRLAREVTDWGFFVTASIEHSILPLAHRHLSSTCRDVVPPPTLERLESLYYQHVARNAFLTHKMLDLLDLLLNAGIRVVPFKGPVIAVALYGEAALRRFDDLDFIVHRDDIRRARQILIEHGFTPHLHMTAAQAEAHLRAGWEIIFRDGQQAYSIELDTGIAPRYFAFALGAERLWQGFEVVRVEGREVRTLSAENLLLLLSAHGTKHLWRKLIWICDIALLAARTDLDWERVAWRAGVLGGRRMLTLALRLAREVLEVELPQPCNKLLPADRVAERLAADVVRRWVTRTPSPHPRLDGILFHTLARERLRDRAAYLWRLAITPSYADWKSLPLPRFLFPLYYLIRPIRLAWNLVRLAAPKKSPCPADGVKDRRA